MTLTALVVDDSKEENHLLTDLLHESGVREILYAQREEEARKKAFQADIILAHRYVSHLDAIAYSRWLRSEDRLFQKPLIMLDIDCETGGDEEAMANGADLTLPPEMEKEEFLSHLKKHLHPRRSRTNLRHITPFVHAAQKLFARVGLQMEHTIPLYNYMGSEEAVDITGIVSFSGRAQGSLMVSMEEELARWLMSKLFWTETPDLETLRDGVGEVVNMIVGNAKQELVQMGVYINLSIPNVIMGKSYKIARPNCEASVCTRLESQFASMMLDLGLIVGTE